MGTETTTVDTELLARVRRISLRMRGLVSGALQGAYLSSVRGSGIEFEEVRPYQPGDEVRSIDWNVTARTGEPHIKTYVEERQLTLLLLLDTSRSMDFGSVKHSKRVKAAEVAALLALVAGENHDQVGLCLFDDEPGFTLAPENKPYQVQRIVREILAARPGAVPSFAKPSSTTTRAAKTAEPVLQTVLEQAGRHLQSRGLVVLVSDFLGLEGESYRRAIARLARRHDVIAVRVVDPFEERLPSAGRLLLEDLESGATLEVDTRSRRVRADWALRAAARREDFRSTCARSCVDTLEISTTDDVGAALLGLFARRARGGALR